MVFLKEFFEIADFEKKNQQTTKKHEKVTQDANWVCRFVLPSNAGLIANSQNSRVLARLKNKRALWPWVAHLRMTVYKGIGEHSSSQSPAMNFDRSAVSFKDETWVMLTN